MLYMLYADNFTLNSAVLNLIYKLCKTLEVEGISYCHWKSNAALDRSASGDNDLDLLIGRADAHRFTEILYRLGFKEAQDRSEKQLPGILHYYGYDEYDGKFVHIHAHYQLILGDDTTKNYHLPIEEPFLASAFQDELFKLPAPEFELIIFVIRMMLKHATWDAILSFHGALRPAEQQELIYLTERVDQTRMHDTLKRDLPFLDRVLFDQCMQSLRPDCSIWFRYKIGRQLHRQLKAYARRSQISDTCLKVWRRGLWGIRRYIFRLPTRKYMAHGGAIIALVGGDGAGKSTAVDELYTWLSRNFATTKVHMGKPRWSWATFLVKSLLKVGRWLGILSHPSLADAQSPTFPGYSWLLWHVLTARDRYCTYIKARRFATNGGLVICDRYPLPQVKFMDGAQTSSIITAVQTNPLTKLLIKLEKNFYQQILLPDLLIVLRVHPEIAVQRRVDEEANWVRNRCQEIWELDWLETSAHIIDAGQPKEEVLAVLKLLVWSKL